MLSFSTITTPENLEDPKESDPEPEKPLTPALVSAIAVGYVTCVLTGMVYSTLHWLLSWPK